MKKTTTLTLAGIIAIGAMSFDILSSGGKAGKTGSPGENTCITGCHTGTALNGGPGSVSIATTPSLTNGYIAGSTYTVDVTVAESVAPNNALFGFDFEALIASGANGGTLAITNATLTQILTKTVNANVRNNVVHTGNGNVGPNTQTFSFNWTAPATGLGCVTFYTTGLAADNSGGTSGDHVYRDTLVVCEGFVGIAEGSASNFNFSVSPNPASDYVNVHFTLKEASSVTVDLMDINGNKVASLISANGMKGDINKTFNVSSYSKGVYFLKIKDENSSSLRKIIIE
ncbi:MAG: T9SS type A sorting domain-containing protein [Bacteroidetes bacterium]|nr:T9SS type A sorting domain-containing protein [Bacteroidota bacterium]